MFWTEPYIFFTTKEPGITAAMRWQAADGSSYVIGHDVRLLDIAEFTTRMAFSPQGKAALFLKEGRLIAPPRDPRFADRQAISRKPCSRHRKNSIYAELATAFQAWQPTHSRKTACTSHRQADAQWLSLFRPIKGNGQRRLAGHPGPGKRLRADLRQRPAADSA